MDFNVIMTEYKKLFDKRSNNYDFRSKLDSSLTNKLKHGISRKNLALGLLQTTDPAREITILTILRIPAEKAFNQSKYEPIYNYLLNPGPNEVFVNKLIDILFPYFMYGKCVALLDNDKEFNSFYFRWYHKGHESMSIAFNDELTKDTWSKYHVWSNEQKHAYYMQHIVPALFTELGMLMNCENSAYHDLFNKEILRSSDYVKLIDKFVRKKPLLHVEYVKFVRDNIFITEKHNSTDTYTTYIFEGIHDKFRSVRVKLDAKPDDKYSLHFISLLCTAHETFIKNVGIMEKLSRMSMDEKREKLNNLDTDVLDDIAYSIGLRDYISNTEDELRARIIENLLKTK